MAVSRKETLEATKIIGEFHERQGMRDFVGEEARKLEDLVTRINRALPPGFGRLSETDHDSQGTKTTTTLIMPARHDYFVNNFRVTEKDFHTKPYLEQFNGAAHPDWSLCFDGKLHDNEREGFLPFFDFTHLTSGECIVKHSTQTAEKSSFDSRQLADPQDLADKLKTGYIALNDLGIDPFLLRDLLPDIEFY